MLAFRDAVDGFHSANFWGLGFVDQGLRIYNSQDSAENNL
jgi:hypothetical protein